MTVPATLLVLALSGCAPMHQLACGSGEQVLFQDSLYFGTVKPPGGIVSAEDWAGFLNSTVTPRFPQGFSVWQAAGQWRGANGAIVRESSYVLNIAHPGDASSEKAVLEIVAAYKSKFEQEAVLRVKSNACGSF